MQVETIGSGNSPSPNPIYDRLFNFMEDSLPDFKILSKKDNGETVDSEDDISEDLVEYLDSRQEIAATDNNRSTAFKFANQSKQGSKKTDIGVRLGRNYVKENRSLVCWIEAKRLPTPKEIDRDEREYVIVSRERINGKRKFNGNGGIQRFKEGKHAAKLPYSIMLGYIQENDADYWLDKINGWIKELAITDSVLWNESDYLQKQKSHKCNRYVSTHNRNGLIRITLHHFWIDLSIND
jgi:hypothetical protein